MSQPGFRLRAVLIPATLFLAAAGCGTPPVVTKPSAAPAVSVSKPIERQVTEYVDFTGRTEAPYSVDIRARVTGYLTKMPFVEGTEVKQGDLLFEIDPRPYKAQLDKAEGDVTLSEAKLKLAKADNARAKNISQMNAGAITRQDLDKYQAAEEEAGAEVIATKASLEGYKINLDFCQVTSPISGRISRYYLTLGNLANQDQTLLTTVVSQDPMYVYFDVDEMTMLQLVRKMMGNPGDLLAQKKLRVFVGLADEKGYPHEGYINFTNNQVNASTGTITARGVFANPITESQKRLLRPGMFVRVRLPTSEPHSAVLVSERAIGTDQGRKYLLVVDKDKKVQYRPVKVGPLQDDGLRVIEEGLKPDEWVIVSGLQLVRPRMEVKPEPEDMPVLPLGEAPAAPATVTSPSDAAKSEAPKSGAATDK